MPATAVGGHAGDEVAAAGRGVVVTRPAELAVAEIEVGLVAVVRQVVAAGAAPLVGATLRHHVEDDAAGGDRRVRAARGDLHLFERVEVVVGRGRTEGRHVRDHHAVHGPDGLVAAGAGANVLGLLAALVAAHVDAVRENARGGLKNCPGITRSRDLLELGLADRGARGNAALVQQRALRRDGDDVLDGGRQRHLDLGVAADVDRDVRVIDGREALELGFQVIAARPETQETELPLGVRHLDLRSAAAGKGHGDPRESGSLIVCDGAVEVAVLQLGEGGAACNQQQQRSDGYDPSPKVDALHFNKPPVWWL